MTEDKYIIPDDNPTITYETNELRVVRDENGYITDIMKRIRNYHTGVSEGWAEVEDL